MSKMYLGIMEQAYSYQIQNLETKFIFALIIQSDTISNTKSQPYYKASVFLARICLMDPRLFNSGNTSAALTTLKEQMPPRRLDPIANPGVVNSGAPMKKFIRS